MADLRSNDDDFDLATLGELVADAKFAMLTTLAAGQTLRSRPLTTLDTSMDGAIWFLVQANSELVREVEAAPRVNLAYAAGEGKFISVSGPAQVSRDRSRAAQLWSPVFAVWFSGPDDPNLAVLRVAAEEVEYWDSPFTTIGRLVGFVKAMATGDDAAMGTHKRVQLDSGSSRATGSSSASEQMYGEGNYAASREYNQATREFVRSGRVEEAAAAAAPENPQEAAELRDAEAQGKSHAKEEDPEVARPVRGS